MEENSQSKKKETKPYLQVDIKSLNNSDGIYNYQLSQYKHFHDEIDKSFFYMRKNNNDIDKKESQELFDNNDGDVLCRIKKSLKNQNKYEMINPLLKPMKKNKNNINQLNNAAWYVIPGNSEIDLCENEDYILNENDIIKFARKKYEIIKININNSENNIKKENNLVYNISQINKKKGSVFNLNVEPYHYIAEHNVEKAVNENVKNNNYNIIKKIDTDEVKENKINNKKENNIERNNNNDIYNENVSEFYSTYEKTNTKNEYEENQRCRICFDIESTKENPKLRLCSCKTYIHFECLKNYIKTKVELKQNLDFTVQTYICKKFNCEVCLAPYPLRFRIKEYNKIYELINYNIAKDLDYIVLESLDYIMEGFNYKIIHVVKLNNDSINIGRNNTNDIIDTDTSVSEKHAVLKYNKEKGYITIENRSERYGTLVLIKGNITVKEKTIGLQVGRSYVTACMIEKNIGENETFVINNDNNDNSTKNSSSSNNE